MIPEGAALSSATDYLYHAGAISGPRVMNSLLSGAAAWRGRSGPGRRIRDPAAQPVRRDVLYILQHGRPVVRLVTIPEGMPSILVQEKLAAIPELTGNAPLPPEGSVLPNSYDWQMGETRAAVAAHAGGDGDDARPSLWAERKADLPDLRPSRRRSSSLRSSKRKPARPSERQMVAGVYCNRLRIGMKLDADPTVIYPITKGKPLGRRIKRSELMADTGYNTYRKPGLPAGPIANPGKDSIAAVLDPASTKAIYFVADGTGGHVFADDYAEHQANVQKWYAIRHARGEM